MLHLLQKKNNYVTAKINSVNIVLNVLMTTLWKLFLKQVCEISLPRVPCLPDISNLAASIIDNNCCSHGSKPQMLKHLFKSIYIPVTLQLQYR